MSYSVPSNIYNIVHPIASQQGVPDAIWEDVVYVESSFNPNAYNASGAYGLFQLLTPGGQGDNAINAGYTKQDLFNPQINATYGVPAVARTWNNLKGSFDPNNVNWWIAFASQSGHPGGSTSNSYTQEVGRTLMADYQEEQNPIQSAVSGVQNAISGAQNSINNINGLLSGATLTNVHNALIKIGVFFVALILVIIGFMVIVRGQQR
jgi:hypothetical protein